MKQGETEIGLTLTSGILRIYAEFAAKFAFDKSTSIQAFKPLLNLQFHP